MGLMLSQGRAHVCMQVAMGVSGVHGPQQHLQYLLDLQHHQAQACQALTCTRPPRVLLFKAINSDHPFSSGATQPTALQKPLSITCSRLMFLAEPLLHLLCQVKAVPRTGIPAMQIHLHELCCPAKTATGPGW